MSKQFYVIFIVFILFISSSIFAKQKVDIGGISCSTISLSCYAQCGNELENNDHTLDKKYIKCRKECRHRNKACFEGRYQEYMAEQQKKLKQQEQRKRAGI